MSLTRTMANMAKVAEIRSASWVKAEAATQQLRVAVRVAEMEAALKRKLQEAREDTLAITPTRSAVDEAADTSGLEDSEQWL